MSVGKVKAVASKLKEFFENENELAKANYLNSYNYVADLNRFKENNFIAKALLKAYDIISNESDELINSIEVRLTREFKYYYPKETIERTSDIDHIIENQFRKLLEFNYPYQTPTLAELIDDVNYYNITSDNLLHIETQLKERYKNAGGFSTYTKVSE